MRPIELNGIINRTQMQERDDSRPVVEQQTMGHMEDKEVMVKSSQINKNDATTLFTDLSIAINDKLGCCQCI